MGLPAPSRSSNSPPSRALWMSSSIQLSQLFPAGLRAVMAPPPAPTCLVLAELQCVLALRLTDADRAADIEAERLEQGTQRLADRFRQRPVATDDTAPSPAPHRLLDDAVASQFPERNAGDRHRRRYGHFGASMRLASIRSPTLRSCSVSLEAWNS